MTPAMYFGIRYAVSRVHADADLAGLLITGTGDVFAPGGDLGGGGIADTYYSQMLAGVVGPIRAPGT
jgi:enoyl-CoA hydratase